MTLHAEKLSSWDSDFPASTSIMPPRDYWRHLADLMPGPQLERLKELSDHRLLEFSPDALPPPLVTAKKLLELVAKDGWIERIIRYRCPFCDNEIAKEDLSRSECSECGQDVAERGGMVAEVIFIRHLAPVRGVDWVIALHGMNTRGAWQEAFSWRISTTWGRSVPLAVYKYGIVVAGVLLPWRRYHLKNDLREKLAVLQKEAVAEGYSGKPDVIAHSFGTWLFGHLLRDELDRDPDQRLQFGRVILTGSILRPDFDWKPLKVSGLVDEVLNHYGSRDVVVPLAQVTIWDAGPSGRRGFDGDQVINICAEDYGHSDFFLPANLDHSYRGCWRPFLTLPSKELRMLPNILDPEEEWRPLPRLLRGILFPIFSLPLLGSVMVLVVVKIASQLLKAQQLLMAAAGYCLLCLIVMFVIIAALGVCQRFRK